MRNNLRNLVGICIPLDEMYCISRYRLYHKSYIQARSTYIVAEDYYCTEGAMQPREDDAAFPAASRATSLIFCLLLPHLLNVGQMYTHIANSGCGSTSTSKYN